MAGADPDLVELPDGGLGDVVDERPVIGAFPRLDEPVEPVPQRAGGRGGAGLETHQHEGPVSPALVGHADDGDLRDPVVAQHRVLELDGGDQLAAGGDDVVDPVDHVEVAPRRDGAHVAGAEPSVDEPVGRLVPEVSGGDPRSADLEFAGGPPVVRLDSVAVYEARLDAGGEPALAEHLCASVGGRRVRVRAGERGDRAGFGEAVSLHDRDAVALDERVEQRLGHRGAADEDLAEVADLLGVRLEALEESLEGGGCGRHLVGSVGGEKSGDVCAGAHDLPRARPGGDDARAGHERRVGESPRHDVVHGDGGQDGVAAA